MKQVYDNVKIIGNIEQDDTGDIGDDVKLYSDGRIGKHVHIAAGCYIVGQGKFELGDYVTLAPRVTIFTSSPDLKNGSAGNKYHKFFKIKVGDVKICRHAFIGASATIKQGVTIGDGAYVSPNSYVTKDVPPWTAWKGDHVSGWRSSFND